ncbi:class I SAM-dependent methyltransferase [Luteipulveratus mongoliensis]|uniref:Methyltransferase n=1 Tax=Luteipulveratus mongoliensis TaxID=571913 RepID=A0A0K1JL36_9MICO|nr:class I SAM-dependent methyltransferase [Luteipulveratus mongoliensis]AKU17288.1 methyltransferase [Luteipulveratus mongoliensis]
MTDYLASNRANWDERAAVHAASPDYDIDRLLSSDTELSAVVAFDTLRLGDVSGQDGVHLQCHIGTDTLSLARLGATMTGVDLSPASLAEGRSLASRAGVEIPYVECDVYDAPAALDGQTFDFVYTGIGAICWLPSIDRWASTVAELLRPGGRLFIREGHPMLWSLDTDDDQKIHLVYPYFEREEPVVINEGTTYVETDHEFTSVTTMDWNHGLGEIVTALLAHGFTLTELTEHDSAPWEALPGLMTRDESGEWRLTDQPERLPCTYTLQAVKR